MLITTRAIIFRATKYGESSLILEAYTELKGLRKYIIGGVRKKNARVPAGLLQVMSLVEIVAYEREDRDMNRLKEVRTAFPFRRIPFDVVRGALGLFMAEVARKTVREREDNQGLFDFLFAAFRYLDESEHSVANLALQYLLEFSTYLGFMPSGEYSADTPFFDLREGQFLPRIPGHGDYLTEEKSQLLYELLHRDREHVHELEMNRATRAALMNDLLFYYRHHVEGMGEINSLGVLREVLG